MYLVCLHFCLLLLAMEIHLCVHPAIIYQLAEPPPLTVVKVAFELHYITALCTLGCRATPR